jgi:hypothetical protein
MEVCLFLNILFVTKRQTDTRDTPRGSIVHRLREKQKVSQRVGPISKYVTTEAGRYIPCGLLHKTYRH